MFKAPNFESLESILTANQATENPMIPMTARNELQYQDLETTNLPRSRSHPHSEHWQLVASCLCLARLNGRSLHEAYPRAVLPTPGGPYTSVTFPLETPPYTGSISKEIHSLFCRKASRRGRPVEMHRVVDALRSCSACAAETVGIRSINSQSKREQLPGSD